MKFTYTQTATDLIEFNYYFSWSRPERKWTRINLSLLPLTMFCFMLFMSKKTFSEFGFYELLLVVLGVVSAFYMKAFIYWQNKFKINKFLKHHSATMLGERLVELTSDTIFYQVGEETVTLPWSEALCLRETQQYFYIFLTQNQAIIIPKSAVGNTDEQEAFTAFVAECFENSAKG